MTDPTPDDFAPSPAFIAPPEAPDLYRAALKCLDIARLREMVQAVGTPERPTKATQMVEAIADRIGEYRVAERLAANLGHPPRLALNLFALSESPRWPVEGLSLALGCLGVAPDEALRPLLDLGLVVLRASPDGVIPPEYIAHPSAGGATRTVLPEGPAPAESGPIGHIRESDGLEPILRLAALWQRLDEAPLRQTMQNSLYKRDRERLEDDPALAGPIADALEPLPDMADLWLALARGVGLIAAEVGSDRIVAARPDYWSENAVHLPQMIASRWLGLRDWHEQGGIQQDGATAALALPFVRPAALLWLAAIPEDAWLAIDDLAAHLTALHPGWDRPTLGPVEPAESPASRPKGGKAKGEINPARPLADVGPLGSLLLGPAYQLGLIRAAEEVPSGRRVVQLTPLGRYALALGPPPPPRTTFEHFLFVQPNFEIIAYRQGLTPPLIGQLSRFARWSQVGAALELKLTAESVYRGLEGGLTPEAMLERLSRHSSRPLPAGVAEAVRTWAERRQRITFHAAATLMEFATAEALQAALAAWPTGERAAPAPITDRLLLVEDEGAIPFQRFRLAGSRDYRRPPDACLEVEPGGVVLALDLGRSDLFVDAELARFADELPGDGPITPGGVPRRRFRITRESLARAAEDGPTAAQLAKWFPQRTGAEMPPAVRLLLHAATPDAPPLSTTRPLILHAPTAELIDGLLQHPTTRTYLGERLGPTAVIIPEGASPGLTEALSALGIRLDGEKAAKGR